MTDVTEETGYAVKALWIYPTKDEPGVALPVVELEPDGLSGDRRKKSALLLVSSQDAVELEPRANLVLDATADQLIGLIGTRARVGGGEIQITRQPLSCPGVYASVIRPGTISVGDRLQPGPASTR